MVRRVRVTGFISGAALFALFACSLPARAKNILEQIQIDLSVLVVRTRAGIVSIEDERIFGPPRAARQVVPNEAALQQIKRAIEEKDREIALLKTKVGANHP